MSFNLGSAHGKIDIDVEGVKKAIQEMNGSLSDAEGGFDKLGSAAIGVSTVLTASLVAAVAAVVGEMALGVHTSMEWADQLEMLHNLLAMSAEDASLYATSMNRVGLSVEDGTAGLTMFVRSAENARLQSQAQANAAGDALAALTESHTSTMTDLAEAMTQAQANAADRTAAIWQNLADQKELIESSLADTIESIREGLVRSEQDMARSRRLELEQFARDGATIDTDAAKTTAKNARDRDKSLASLDKDETKAMLGARSLEQQAQIRREFADRREQIKADAEERAKEIEERRKEHQAELAERKREAKEQFDYQFARNQEQARRQEEIAEKAALKAEERAEKQAIKAEAVADKQAAREEAAIKKREDREEAMFTRQTTRISSSLERVQENNPFTRALNKLKISATDAGGSMREATDIFDEFLERIGEMPPSLERSQILLALFGRGGAKFFEWALAGKEGTARAKELAEAFGLILTPEELERQTEFRHTLDEWKVAFTGLHKAVAAEVLPTLMKLSKEGIDWLVKNGPAIRATIHQIADGFRTIAAAIKTGNWDKLIDMAKGALGGLMTMIGKWITDNSPKLQAQLLEWANRFWTWISDPEAGAIVQGIEKLSDLLDSFARWAVDPGTQGQMEEGGHKVATSLLTGLEDLLKSPLVKKVLSELLPKLAVAVAEAGAALLNIGANIAKGILKGLLEELISGRLGAALLAFNNALGKGVLQLVVWFMDAGTNVAKDIIGGLLKGFEDQKEKVKDKLREIIENAIAAIKDFFGMHSPSEAFADLGRNMALGLIKGYGQPKLDFAPVLGGLGQSSAGGGFTINGGVTIQFNGVGAPRTQAEAEHAANLFLQALRARGGTL